MTDPALIEQIKSWKVEDHPQFCLGCDVGGSGLRIRLANFLNPDEYVDFPHIKAQTTKEMIDALNNFCDQLLSIVPNAEAKGAAIAVAGPITDNTVVFTNWAGPVEGRTVSLSQLPVKLFPEGKSYFLNDLEAGAYGILAAEKSGILESSFDQLFLDKAPKGPLISSKRTAVLAMGSGFGVALIVKNPLFDVPVVIPTELGHLQIPVRMEGSPEYPEERGLMQFLANYYYEGKLCPEYEDVASGRGLPLAYQYLYEKEKGEKVDPAELDAGKIAVKANNGDPIARRALTWHYKIFTRAAKCIATSLSCDSVLLALDNQVKNNEFVRSIEKELNDEFYTWIRPDWMNSVRVYTQKVVLNFNILGTTYMANQIAHMK